MANFIEFSMRHPLLVGGTLLAIIALIVNELRLRFQSGFSVPAQKAVQLINQGATVVDVRESARFNSGHIIDAINVPAAEVKAHAEARLKKKRTVLLVCDTGSSSSRLVASLRQAGFENAWSLDGGLTAWQRDNLPVASTRAKA